VKELYINKGSSKNVAIILRQNRAIIKKLTGVMSLALCKIHKFIEFKIELEINIISR